jgi:two-component system cell cycle sensor histidine kinase/response regulator CckA
VPEGKFKALVESSQDLTLVQDAGGRLTYVSPAARALLGRDPEEMLGQPSRHFSPPEEHPRQYEEQQRLLGAPSKPLEVLRRFFHADGSQRVLEGSAVNLLADPAVGGIAFSLRDITNRDLLQTQAQKVLRLESVGRLAGGLAHDFNNVLTVVQGQLDLLEGRGTLDDRGLRSLAEIRVAAGRAAQMVGQLLAYARRSVVAPRPLEVNTALDGLLPALRSLCGESISISFSPGAGLQKIKADSDQFEQLVVTLASHAAEAMPSGGSLAIGTEALDLESGEAARLRGLMPGRYVRLQMRDSGVGMDTHTRDHAFEPFFSTRYLGRVSGLGLATCEGIVSQAGGRISLESELGKGSTFTVDWPCLGPGSDQGAEAEAGAGGEAKGRGELVLLVEDETQVLSVVRQGLAQAGYQVSATAKPEEALAWVRQGLKPVLLVTDVVMPVYSGLELARLLGGLAPDLRVLYMSGYAPHSIAGSQTLKPGVNFIQKPFTKNELARFVRRALDASGVVP